MIQDKLYLETCARLKMKAVAASPNFKDIEAFEFRHKSSLEYPRKVKEICITMLGIPESTVETTPRSVQLDTSERFYTMALQNEDALLGYYIVLLPCVLTYWKIAERLMNDPSTAKNVVYHEAWTVVNYDRSSVDKYTKFINENIAAKGGVERWNWVFRIACELEAELFNTGVKAPTPFRVIPDGTYFVHSSHAKSVVLAIQNVAASPPAPSDKPAGGCFPSNAGSLVVGRQKAGADNERWNVVATPEGYTFQNLVTSLYLGISTERAREEARILHAVSEPYHWWINPVSSQRDRGTSVYRIFSCQRGFADQGPIQIMAHENSCQMWSFGDKFEPLQHAQMYPEDKEKADLAKLLQPERAIYTRETNPLGLELDEFINRVTRSGKLCVGRSAKSCTAAIEAGTPIELHGRQVVLLDTPSFDHTDKSQAEILRNIAFELETKYRQGIKLHGIIYLYRISDVRVSNAAKQDFLCLRKLCGNRSIRNVVILTTMWDSVNAQEGRRRAADLQFLPDLFRPALEDGARLMHHTDGTVVFVHEIFKSIIKNQPEALAIQEQLVDKDMDIDQTSIGKEVDGWIAKRIEGYEAQDDEQWDLAEQARMDGDEKTRSELLEESENIRAQIAKLKKEKVGQALDYKRHRQLNQTGAGAP
ncbi:hypothetical protein K438DRAFT_1928097 [Mycena galopus ATCC 62051]|nr:hypothetical protein K438DRAFT_1928097 [Mycena galopus ATCC 62051]